MFDLNSLLHKLKYKCQVEKKTFVFNNAVKQLNSPEFQLSASEYFTI